MTKSNREDQKEGEKQGRKHKLLMLRVVTLGCKISQMAIGIILQS